MLVTTLIVFLHVLLTASHLLASEFSSSTLTKEDQVWWSKTDDLAGSGFRLHTVTAGKATFVSSMICEGEGTKRQLKQA